MNQKRGESIAHYATLNALWLALTVQDTALMTIAVPASINKLAPATHIESLAFLVAIANLAAMLVPPVAGWLSDKHRREWGGTRRIWVLAGLAIDIAALVAIAFAHSLVAFDLLFILAIAGENLAVAAYQALIPEVVPRHAWGVASGIRGAATLVGTVAGLSIAGTIARPDLVFLATALILALGSLTLFAVTEREWEAPERTHIVRWHDFIVVFIARLFVFFGLTLLMTFVLYFFQDVLQYKNPSAGTAFFGVCSLLGAIASSVFLGVASDRFSRKTIVALCGVPMAIAATGFALAPIPPVMLVAGVLFGVGLGGVVSVGWALAIDSLPAIGDIARDLGLWGIATNLPTVIAPIVGGAILHAFGGSRIGYQTIFALAGVSFACGSLTVLRVGARPISSMLTMPLWIAAMCSVNLGMHVRNRVRSWGRLKRNRGGTLVIANHQTDLEAMVVVSGVGWHSSWRHPVFAATSGRMWEPGFFALRFPWLYRFMRNLDAGPLFRSLGMIRIENELSSRALSSLAWSVRSRHGDMLLSEAFSDGVAGRYPTETKLSDLWNAQHFVSAQNVVKISKLREPFRSGVVAEMREQLEREVAEMEDVVARGATFYLTPEGRHSRNGELLPMRGLLPRLSKFARSIYLAGVSYDIFRSKKLSILYRVVELRDRDAIAEELCVARPVTFTQLLSSWLYDRDEPFRESDALSAVKSLLAGLPRSLFVDPELARDPRRVTHEALRAMINAGFLTLDGAYYRIARRTDALFAHADDIFAYHARFFGQSVEAATRSSQPEPSRHSSLR